MSTCVQELYLKLNVYSNQMLLILLTGSISLVGTTRFPINVLLVYDGAIIAVSRHLRTTTVLGTRQANDRLIKLAQAEIDDLDAQGITLHHIVRSAEHGETIRLEETGDRDILDFSKNSYLGLSVGYHYGEPHKG